MFLSMETASQPMHVMGLGIYDQSQLPDGKLRFKQILAHIESRLDRSSVFRRKLVRVPLELDRPYWIEDPEFDLEFHVRHVALPEPRDRRQLYIEASRFHARQIDTARPLWEWWIIEGLDNVDGVPPGCFAVLFKIHHAAVDGMEGREMIDVAHDRSRELPAAQNGKEWNPARPPGAARLLTMAAANTVRQPFRLLRTLQQSVPLVKETLNRGYKNSPLYSAGPPRTRFNASVSAPRVHNTIKISLADLRKIRAAVPGSTVNDAVVTIVAGALREYLTGHGELPEATLVAGVPISIRTPDQAQAGGNQAIAAMISLSTDVPEPIERLRRIHRETTAKKEFTNAVPAHVLTDMAQFMPGSLMMLAARTGASAAMANRTQPRFNLTITNVPGWREELFFCGAPMVEYEAFGPLWDGMGLIHVVSSYRENVVLSFDAVRAFMPDPDVYHACVGRSAKALLKAATKPDKA